ncbi:MAG: GNAT family N-acetyltransferase [Ilumatobacteraceae bacterium]
MTDVPRLQTDRLLLREWHDSDRAPYAALNADPVVMEHFPSTLTEQQSDEMVDRIVAKWADGFGLFAVEVTDPSPDAAHLRGRFIGFVGLAAPTWTTWFTPCVEIGWRLARHSWGRGYAPEAARAVLAWGFGNVDLPDDEIVSFTTVANTKSRRVMEKIGMVHDPSRDFDHPVLAGWEGRRHVLYCIDRTRSATM